MPHRTLAALALLAAAVAASTGCARHYRVVDPATGRIFYSDDVDEHRDGAVRFRDVRTSREMTLMNAQVDRIPGDEFDRYVDPQ